MATLVIKTLQDALSIEPNMMSRTFIRLLFTDGRGHWDSQYHLDLYKKGNPDCEIMAFNNHPYQQSLRWLKLDNHLDPDYTIPDDALFLMFVRLGDNPNHYLFTGYHTGTTEQRGPYDNTKFNALLGHLHLHFHKQDAAKTYHGSSANRLMLFPYTAVNDNSKVEIITSPDPYNSVSGRKSNFETWYHLTKKEKPNNSLITLLSFPKASFSVLPEEIQQRFTYHPSVFDITDKNILQSLVDITSKYPDNNACIEFKKGINDYIHYLSDNNQSFNEQDQPPLHDEQDSDSDNDSQRQGTEDDAITLQKVRKLLSDVNDIASYADRIVPPSNSPFAGYPNLPRNIVLTGAPGTGKSYAIEKLFENESAFDKHGERVTFYADYMHTQFVGTYKPLMSTAQGPDQEGKIIYGFQPGPFTRVLIKALNDPSHNYALIIEELNRADAASVFGDLFQLLDRKSSEQKELDGVSAYPTTIPEDLRKYLFDGAEKHGHGLSLFGQLVLRHLIQQDEPASSDIDNVAEAKEFLEHPQLDSIVLPGNLYILATANPADQGVTPLDTAFKRRWCFEHLSVDMGENDCTWNECRKLINENLLDCEVDEDKLLGPHFLTSDEQENASLASPAFNNAMKSKIIAYLFGDAAQYQLEKVFNLAKIRGTFHRQSITLQMLFEYWDKHNYGIFLHSDKLTDNIAE